MHYTLDIDANDDNLAQFLIFCRRLGIRVAFDAANSDMAEPGPSDCTVAQSVVHKHNVDEIYVYRTVSYILPHNGC